MKTALFITIVALLAISSIANATYLSYAYIYYPTPTTVTIPASGQDVEVQFTASHEYGSGVTFGSCGTSYCSMTIHDNVNQWYVFLQTLLGVSSASGTPALKIYVNGTPTWTFDLNTSGTTLIDETVSGSQKIWNLGDTISLYVSGGAGTQITFYTLYGRRPFPTTLYFHEAA